MKFFSLVALLVSTLHQCQTARILAIFPMPAPSHHYMFRAVLSTLADRGHEVVCYTAVLQDIVNYTQIPLDTVEKVDKVFTMDFVKKTMSSSKIAAASLMTAALVKILEQTFQSDEVKRLVTSNEHFDLIILEAHFGQEALLLFGHKFQAPVVLLQTFDSYNIGNKITGNSLSLATIPEFSLPFSDKMTFYERAINSYSVLKTMYLYYYETLPQHEKLARDFLKDSTMPSVVEMIHNVSLLITNAHPFVHYTQVAPPNIVPVGGIHLAKTRKPLPQDIQKFMDEAKNGVIYFCLGSFLRDKELPQSHFDNFVSVFRGLPERVIWKTSYQDKNLPKNVKVVKWAPQHDILAHPKTVLFITHGGLFGQHEAIHAGVPVVCIPFFVDQPNNAKFYEERGIGVQLLFESLSESTIKAAITGVLGDKTYKENMQRLSLVYRDRPVSPSDSLVFWVEYVLRHRGAPHLRPVSSQMSWYQLALLDVLAADGIAFTISIFVVYIVVHKIVRLLLGSKRKNTNSKKNK